MSFRYYSPHFVYPPTREGLERCVVENMPAVRAITWRNIGPNQEVGLMHVRWWALLLLPFLARRWVRRAHELVDQQKPARVMILLRVW